MAISFGRFTHWALATEQMARQWGGGEQPQERCICAGLAWLLSNSGGSEATGSGRSEGLGWGGTDGFLPASLTHSPQRSRLSSPRKGAQEILTTPWREGGMRPQYTGMKALQTLACGAGTEGNSEQGLWGSY